MRYSEFLKNNYTAILRIIDCMKVGVWITDGKGTVMMVNTQSESTGGLSRKEVIGKTMEELIEIGYILYESSVLKAIKSHKEESIVQALGEGGHLLATSVPMFYKNEVDLIICIERDITDIVNLEELLNKQKTITYSLRKELESFKGVRTDGNEEMIANSMAMIKIRDRAINIGKTDATVIITGESGTGKEVLANLIQKSSKRADEPFIKINCAAIPETLLESEFFGYEKGSFTGADKNGKIGFFELADSGTLFLDEIGDLPLAMQSKLLRVIQEKEVRRIGGEVDIPVNVRIIAATNKDLKEEMEKGNFRSDLYYRLFVVPIELPPLRQRKEDIGQMCYKFLNEFNEEYGLHKKLSRDALEIMENYSWPGNVRELRNIIERLVVSEVGEEITSFQLQMCLKEKEEMATEQMWQAEIGLPLDEMMKNYEKHLITQALEISENATAAAKLLHIDKSTMSKKRKKYKI